MLYSQRRDDFVYIYHDIPERVDDVSDEEMRQRNTTSKADHGERTNPKLVAQPFYHRQRNGKMKQY